MNPDSNANPAAARLADIYQQAIAAAGAVPYVRDYVTNRFMFMGDGIEALTGYTASEITPALWQSLHDPECRFGSSSGWSEERIHTRDGSDRWIADSFVETVNEQGVPTGSVGILQDITERRLARDVVQATNLRLESALARLQAVQEQMVQQERLRAMGEMASGIAHDFNNALAPVLGFAELLLANPEQLDKVERITQYVTNIRTATLDAAAVVRRLSEFYRQPGPAEAKRPLDLNALINQTVLLTQPKWRDQAIVSGYRVELDERLAPVPVVHGVEAELREAFTNLIFNAVDALPTGGVITVSSSGEDGCALVRVSDTGMGMTAETRQRCFEPFYTTKGLRGTGLGLAMVHGIITRHGGTIEVESELNCGTTFVIRLLGSGAAEVLMAPRQANPTKAGLRILVAEDEPLVREVICQLLRLEGHDVIAVDNGVQALDYLRTTACEVVITDRSMPRMSGDELALAMVQHGIETPVILLTGIGEFIRNSDAKLPGIRSVVSKPVTLTALREAIAAVLTPE